MVVLLKHVPAETALALLPEEVAPYVRADGASNRLAINRLLKQVRGRNVFLRPRTVR